MCNPEMFILKQNYAYGLFYVLLWFPYVYHTMCVYMYLQHLKSARSISRNGSRADASRTPSRQGTRGRKSPLNANADSHNDIIWHEKISRDSPSRKSNHSSAKSRHSVKSSQKTSASPVEHDASATSQAYESEEAYEEEIVEIPDISQDGFKPFIEFPTPHLLREANQEYTLVNQQSPIHENDDKKLIPYPTPSTKTKVFQLEKYAKIDARAIEVH